MSTDVDEKVVAMKLNNSQFETEAKRSLGTLDSISKALKLDGASKGLRDVSVAAKNTNFGSIAAGIDALVSKFNALSVVGITALSTIANKAVNAGLQMAQSLTIEPIKSGFDEYELKLGSIQTILSNTARFGTKLPEVTKNLDALNKYADKTIYNFGDMTKNIGLFTNAGIKIADATQMIQGFSNEAAASGTSAQGAASAAYQLSQALSAGKITLMDWKSLQTVGMGNKNMQNGLLELAKAMGTVKKTGSNVKDIQNNFNASLQKGWLTADVMSKYLRIMATDFQSLTPKQLANQKAQLRGIGLTNKQIDAFILQQKNAQESATKVRTFTQLVGTVRESIGSGWSETFELIIGNFDSATALWTKVNDSLGATIGRMSDARNKLVTGWVKAGGRTAMIDALKNAFQALGIVIKAVRDAFRSVFPPTTGKQLADMTKGFRDFTAKLKMGPETADKLKRTFAGLFSILKIGYTIISGVVSTIGRLFGLAQGGAGGFLTLTAAVGDFIVKIQQWLISSGRIKSFFATIDTARSEVIVPLISIIGKMADAFGSLFSGNWSEFATKMKNAFGGLGDLIHGLWMGMTSQIRGLLANLRDATGVVAEFIKGLGIKALVPIQTALAKLSENFGKLREIINDLAKNGFKLFNKGADGAKSTMGAASNFGKKVAEVWESVQEAFQKAQNFLAPMTSSIGKLFTTITDKISDFIKGMDMQDAIALVNTGFFILMYKAIRDFMKNLQGLTDVFKNIGKGITDVLDTIKTSVTDTLSMMQKNIKSNIILKIAIAIGILAAALLVLSQIDPKKLAIAIGAVGILLTAMTLSMKSMLNMLEIVEGKTPASAGQILAAGSAMLLLAGAILLLSVAVQKLSGLNWQELAKGLVGVAVLLGALALFTKFSDMEGQSIKGAASLALLAGTIYLLSFSVAKLGEMDTKKLVQGGVALGAILAMLSATAAVFSTFGNKGVPGIIAMAGALAILTPIIIALGFVPYEVLAKGLGTIAIALGLLAGTAVLFAKFGNKGAPGIIAMATALLILAPVIFLLGEADYVTLAKGLGAIAIAFGILAGAAALMGNPLTLSGAAALVILSTALLALAPVVLLLGQADLKTLAIGLGAIAAGFLILIAAGAGAMAVAPGLIVLGQAIALIGVAMLAAGVGFAAFGAGFAVLAATGAAGFAVLTAGFVGLINLIPLLAQQVGLGMRAIGVVIAQSGPIIVNAITTVLISFLKAMERAAPQFFSTMKTIILGLINVVTTLIPVLAERGAQMILQLLTTLNKYIGPMADKATDLMISFINAISKNTVKLVDAGAKAVIDLINGLADTIRKRGPELGDAGGNLASAIIDGMVGGLGAGVGRIVDAAKGVASSALDAAKRFLGIASPSKEFEKLGKFSVEGFAKGLKGNKSQINAATSSMKSLLSDTLKAVRKDIVDAEARLSKLTKARHKDIAAINKTKKALAESRAEEKKVVAASDLLKKFSAQQKQLGTLSDSYDKITSKLEAARKSLADAIKTRDDFAKTTTDQFNNLPAIDKDTKLSDFVTSLEKQVADTQIFSSQLQELRKRGLSDAMYKELLSKGTDAIPFAKQLLDGGKDAITQVNTLGSALEKTATQLGNTASKALYQAAVDSAAGLVKGLEAQQKNIEKVMDKIADAMVKAIKQKLGIKSPSKVFKQLGAYSGDGLAEGLKQSIPSTAKVSELIANNMMNSMRDTLKNLSTQVASSMDVDPTIRPVLDLTSIKQDASRIGGILGGNNVKVSASLARARVNSNEINASAAASAAETVSAGASVRMTQNNYSPKALSQATIYRQTKNQISAVKGALRNK